MDKKQLSERDIYTKYITPALERSGWDVLTQVQDAQNSLKQELIRALGGK
jgi:type I restriction enzyme, R subunit